MQSKTPAMKCGSTIGMTLSGLRMNISVLVGECFENMSMVVFY